MSHVATIKKTPAPTVHHAVASRSSPPISAAVLPSRYSGEPTPRADEADAPGNPFPWRLAIRSYDDGGMERFWQEAVNDAGDRIVLNVSDFACGPIGDRDLRILARLGFPTRLGERLSPITRAQLNAAAVECGL